VPPPLVTVTSTTPVLPAGDVAVICVALLTVKLVALVAPNLTAVATVKLVPLMLTEVPPPVVPVFGAMPVTVGAVGITAMLTIPLGTQVTLSLLV